MQGNKVIIFFLFFFTYSNGHPIFDGNEFSDEDIEYIMNVTEGFKLLLV